MSLHRNRLLFVVGNIVLMAGLMFWQAKPSQSEDSHEVTPHHLVGHEDAPLLARVQDVIDDLDPRKLQNPLVITTESLESKYENDKDGKPVLKEHKVVRKQLRRPDLAQFIADVDAAEALGKAFFWEMQAGSDFRREPDGMFIGTACASCHYRHGADARDTHTTRLPWVVWDQYALHADHPLEFGERQLPYRVEDEATKPFPFAKHQAEKSYSLIVGSQGVEPLVFKKLTTQSDDKKTWKTEEAGKRSLDGFTYKPEWSMFIQDQKVTKKNFRQITNRNSPSVINAGFADRLFHDGRAESTFNGFSIFGDADPREVIHRRRVTQILDAEGKVVKSIVDIEHVRVALTKAALASQAVGPIVNEVEMSYEGRAFPDLADKLLDAEVLGFQTVDDQDSVLGRWKARTPNEVGIGNGLTYQQLIQRAFRPEWWSEEGVEKPGTVPLVLLRDREPNPKGSLMQANFSLYWGMSIMLYEASLVSNQSPFDDMMRGRTEKVEAKWAAVKTGNGPDDRLQPILRDQATHNGNPPAHESGAAVFQHGFRVFMNRSCVDCHDGPLFSELYERLPEEEQFPIHYTLERALLPNSRADAMAINLREARAQLLSQIKSLLDAKLTELINDNDIAAAAREQMKRGQARLQKIAWELDRLRGPAQGKLRNLEESVEKYLDAAFLKFDSATSAKIANLLFQYEKTMVQKMGNRTFFTEDERVAMAEALAGPVLVELMPIPKDQVAFRRPLPISGPLAQQDYAFYDGSFYALGVAPPRYDRGNGDKHSSLHSESKVTTEMATMNAVSQIANSPRQADEKLRRAVGKYKQLKGEDIRLQVMSDKSLNPEDKARFESAIQQELAVSFPSAAGSAYRFDSNWNTDRYKSQMAPSEVTPMTEIKAHIDTSWDRDDIPFGDGTPSPGAGHRSQHYFLSRARRMVFDEEEWGYRKPLLHDNEIAFWGAFKTPSLRNVELTAPYMHNGRFMTLTDVVEFYDEQDLQIPRDQLANPDKHPEINGIDLTDDDKRALVFFLMCLTDDRVQHESGPFDHPSLNIVNGYTSPVAGTFEEVRRSVPSVGQSGHEDFSRRFPSAD